jgi:Protein of unknown function (DUF2778)
VADGTPFGEAAFKLDARGMTFVSVWHGESGDYGYRRSSPNALQRHLGCAALAAVAVICVWALCADLVGGDTGPIDVSGTRADRLDFDGGRGDKLVAAKPHVPNAGTPETMAPADYAALFDPNYTLGHSSGTFAGSIYANTRITEAFVETAPPSNLSLPSQDQVATRAPSPVRPAQDAPSSPQIASVAQGAAVAAPQIRTLQVRTAAQRESAAADRVAATPPTIFERLFGKRPAPALAYASADDGMPGHDNALTGDDGQTAVYDISAHTVYMPDGTRLEAHSGLGGLLDNPRYAAAKDRGVTPPNVYDLTLRESLFHGVQALRLIPKDEAKVFGRSGLLAHSFMLGPNGDSNGCVSFRDYEAFLHAYLNHEVRRLVVVAGQG